jgi:hypothetical protein
MVNWELVNGKGIRGMTKFSIFAKLRCTLLDLLKIIKTIQLTNKKTVGINDGQEL